MATGSDNEEERTETNAPASTPQLDCLEKLAKAATTSAQAKQWRARQNGLQEQDEPWFCRKHFVSQFQLLGWRSQ